MFPTANTFSVYRSADPRVAFTLDLGLDIAPSVEELANGDASCSYTISEEPGAASDASEG